MSGSPPSDFWLGLSEGSWLDNAGVLRPVGIGGRTDLTLDLGRLSAEGDAVAASCSAPGWGSSAVWPDETDDSYYTVTG